MAFSPHLTVFLKTCEILDYYRSEFVVCYVAYDNATIIQDYQILFGAWAGAWAWAGEWENYSHAPPFVLIFLVSIAFDNGMMSY